MDYAILDWSNGTDGVVRPIRLIVVPNSTANDTHAADLSGFCLGSVSDNVDPSIDL